MERRGNQVIAEGKLQDYSLFLANNRKIKDRRDGKEGGVNVTLLVLFHPLCTIQGPQAILPIFNSTFWIKGLGSNLSPLEMGEFSLRKGLLEGGSVLPLEWKGTMLPFLVAWSHYCIWCTVGEVIFDGSFENLLHSTKFLMTDYRDLLERNSFVSCMCVWGASMKSRIDFTYKFTYYFIYYCYIFI